MMNEYVGILREDWIAVFGKLVKEIGCRILL